MPKSDRDAVGGEPCRRQRHEGLEQRREGLDRDRRDAHRGLGGVRRVGEDVDHLAGRLGARVGQVEGLAVSLGAVRDVVHGRGHEVHRNQVDLPALDAQHRHPLGDRVAEATDQLEEVVGAVDLVHLAGLRVPHHDPRPVHPPRPGAVPADHGLRLVLGPEVRIGVEVLSLVEHVLPPGPLVETGGGDRADHVDAAGLDRLGELDHVAGALHIGEPLAFRVGGHVVDRRQVEEVVDVARQA